MEIGQKLQELLDSEGGIILMRHVEEEIKDGWEKFIALPVNQKTSKAAYNYQAKYEVLRDLKDWISSTIRANK